MKDQNRYNFYSTLKNNSVSNEKDCVEEWILESSYTEDNNCICRHPIYYNYVIKNKYNNNELIVGSSCKKLFDNNDELIDKIKYIDNKYKYIKKYEKRKLVLGKYSNKTFKEIYDLKDEEYINQIINIVYKKKSPMYVFVNYLKNKKDIEEIHNLHNKIV